MSEINQEIKVCVLLPVQNSERTVQQTINSLINQTFKNFKILVVDDGSTDNTARILNKIEDDRLHILKFKKSVGLIHALNWAISEIDEKYIVMAHANSVSHPERLQRQVKFMDENIDTGICGSKILNGSDDKIPLADAEIRANLLFCNSINHETVIIRTSLLEEQGFRYRDKYPGMADYDLWFRLMPATKFANLDEPLVEMLPERPHDFKFTYSRAEATSFFVEKFTKMGIIPAEKELLVHVDLCKMERVKRFSSPPRYKNWMDKLIQINRTKKLFPQVEFEKLLEEKWKLLYPYMLNENSKKIKDYMLIDGHSQLEIFKFLIGRKLKNIFHI